MNIVLKNRINNFAKEVSKWLDNLVGIIASILRIAVLSSLSVVFKPHYYKRLRKNATCILLGNGPSLKDAFQNGCLKNEKADFFCVNCFCESELFWIIKPSLYFLVDGGLFYPKNERAKKRVAGIINALSKVDWEITLAVPSYYTADHIITQISNNNVSVVKFNTTKLSGFNWFKNLCYQFHLGMPVCTNVTVFAIMAAVWMGYDKVLLYGIELGMFTHLTVDQENVLCSESSHVYEEEKMVCKRYGRSLADELQGYVDCFNSHTEINRYATMKGCRILNGTKGSFIDAYKKI